MKKTGLLCIFAVLIMFSLSSCSDNAVTSPAVYDNLVYSKSGLIDSITGTCQGATIRSYEIGDSLDFRNTDKIRIDFESGTDSDISELSVYYRRDTLVKIMSISGEDVNNLRTYTVDSPGIKDKFYAGITFKSSVCTGEVFYFKLRDLKVYTK